MDLELAQEVAKYPEEDDVRKKLWLRIVQHVIQTQENVKKYCIWASINIGAHCVMTLSRN